MSFVRIYIYNTNANQQKVNINVKKIGFFDICRFFRFMKTCGISLIALRVDSFGVHDSLSAASFNTNWSAEKLLRQYIVI